MGEPDKLMGRALQMEKGGSGGLMASRPLWWWPEGTARRQSYLYVNWASVS